MKEIRKVGERSARVRALACAVLIYSLPAKASAQGVPVEAATFEQKKEATALYREAVKELDAGRAEEALALLRKSYAVVNSPNSRLLIARALAGLGRSAEAYEEFRAVAQDAAVLARGQEKYQQTAEAAQAGMDELKPKVALVTLRLDGKVVLNGVDLIDAAVHHLVLPPGEAHFKLQLVDAGAVEKRLTLAGGTETTVDLRIPPQAPRERERVVHRSVEVIKQDPNSISRDTLGVVSASVGVIGFVGFTAFGIAANNEASTLAAQCVDVRCDESLADTAERGRTYQTLANVGLGLGVAGAVATAYFFWPRIEEKVFGTHVAVGPGNVRLWGHF